MPLPMEMDNGPTTVLIIMDQFNQNSSGMPAIVDIGYDDEQGTLVWLVVEPQPMFGPAGGSPGGLPGSTTPQGDPAAGGTEDGSVDDPDGDAGEAAGDGSGDGSGDGGGG